MSVMESNMSCTDRYTVVLTQREHVMESNMSGTDHISTAWKTKNHCTLTNTHTHTHTQTHAKFHGAYWRPFLCRLPKGLLTSLRLLPPSERLPIPRPLSAVSRDKQRCQRVPICRVYVAYMYMCVCMCAYTILSVYIVSICMCMCAYDVKICLRA